MFGDNAIDSGIPVEVWRYYLLSNRPEQQDTSFAWDNLGVQNNSELLNNLVTLCSPPASFYAVPQGNFINRALKFVEKFYGSIIPDASPEGADACREFGAQLLIKIQTFIEKMEAIQLRASLGIVMDISATGNKFLQVPRQDPTFRFSFLCV